MDQVKAWRCFLCFRVGWGPLGSQREPRVCGITRGNSWLLVQMEMGEALKRFLGKFWVPVCH